MQAEQVTRYPKARRAKRLGAFMIDHFFILSSTVTLFFLILGPNIMDTEDEILTPFTVMLTLPLLLFGLYFGKDSYKGISLGKWILGIMVRKADDHSQVPSSINLFLRNLLLVIWPVELIVLALSTDKKRLGDKSFGTEVVENPVQPSSRARVAAIVAPFVLIFVSVAFIVFGALKNSSAYKAAIAEIEQNEEILGVTGRIVGYGWLTSANVSVTNGEGEAYYRIAVKGENQDVVVFIDLYKDFGEDWEVERLEWRED